MTFFLMYDLKISNFPLKCFDLIHKILLCPFLFVTPIHCHIIQTTFTHYILRED